MSCFSFTNCTCPYPLVVSENADEDLYGSPYYGTGCAIPCPSVSFTESEWNTARTVQESLAPIAFALTFFLFLSWLCFKPKKVPVIAYAMYVALLQLVVMLQGPLSSTEAHLSTSGCADNVSFHSDKGSACAIFGGLTVFLVNSLTCWWLCIIVDVFTGIVLRKPMLRPFPLFTWGQGAERRAVLFTKVCTCVCVCVQVCARA